MPSKFITYDQQSISVDAHQELTYLERRKLRRFIRDIPESVRGFLEMNQLPKELVNKVKIKIE